MTDTKKDVSAELNIQVVAIGQEKTPLILVDNFLTDTKQIISHACDTAQFELCTDSAFPGVKADLSREYVINTLKTIYKMLYQVYSIPNELKLKTRAGFYGMVSKLPSELNLLQCMPHTDSNYHYQFAVLHYLGEGSFGGTGFFRHKPTGFEKVTEPKHNTYIEAAIKYIDNNGEPEKNYMNSSTDHYELFHTIDYKPNRLVIYPSCLLHSGLIRPGKDLGSDPKSCRLTANIFVEFK